MKAKTILIIPVIGLLSFYTNPMDAQTKAKAPQAKTQSKSAPAKQTQLKPTQPKLTPIELNDKFASLTDSLFKKGKEWGAAYNEAKESGDYSGLRKYSNALVKFIKESQKMVAQTPDVGGSQSYKQVMLDFLNYELGLIQSGFAPFEKFTKDTPKQEVEAALQKLSELAKDEGVQVENIQKAQDAYAAKNGFTIEAAPASDTEDEDEDPK